MGFRKRWREWGWIFLCCSSGYSANLDLCWRALHQMESLQSPRERNHPDLVDKNRLVPGAVIYLDPSAFFENPNIKKKMKGPIRMRLLSQRSVKKGQWQEAESVSYLWSAETGIVAYDTERLSHQAYANPDFYEHAAFSPGEYVQIGLNGELRGRRYRTKQGEWRKQLIPTIGRFSGVYDKNHYLVRVGTRENFEILRVPVFEVGGFVNGTLAVANRVVAPFHEMSLDFRYGEEVRFRDDIGLIAVGAFRKCEGEHCRVVTAEGDTVIESKENLFKVVGDSTPYSPRYERDWLSNSNVPKVPWPAVDLLQEYLNAAAKITSIFSGEFPERELELLMAFVEQALPYEGAARLSERAGLVSLIDNLCAGAGVCRHQVLLFSFALAEAGISHRLVFRRTPIEDPIYKGNGHVWLEVDRVLPNGAHRTYLVDPAGSLVLTWEEVRTLAAKEPESLEAFWYLHPERQYYFPTPEGF